jgi:hypothetical protein
LSIFAAELSIFAAEAALKQMRNLPAHAVVYRTLEESGNAKPLP